MIILDIAALLFLTLGPIYFGYREASSKRGVMEKVGAFIEGVFSTVILAGISVVGVLFFISLFRTIWSNIFG